MCKTGFMGRKIILKYRCWTISPNTRIVMVSLISGISNTIKISNYTNEKLLSL